MSDKIPKPKTIKKEEIKKKGKFLGVKKMPYAESFACPLTQELSKFLTDVCLLYGFSKRQVGTMALVFICNALTGSVSPNLNFSTQEAKNQLQSLRQKLIHSEVEKKELKTKLSEIQAEKQVKSS